MLGFEAFKIVIAQPKSYNTRLNKGCLVWIKDISYADMIWLQRAELRSKKVFNWQIFKQKKENKRLYIKSWGIKEKYF